MASACESAGVHTSAPRLVYVVTHAASADVLLRGQLGFMRERGFDVTVVSSPGPELERVARREGVHTIGLPIARPIRPADDLRTLARLTNELRHLAPHIVNASTAKAGLLGMMAAKALRVPVRVYLMRGLRLETTTGHLRRVLGVTERIASGCATDVVCNSRSLRHAVAVTGFVHMEKARVLGEGSSNGVDAAHWSPTPEVLAEGRRRTGEAGIADDAPVIGFVGRFDPDKGLADLLAAFARVRMSIPRARLMLVGGGYAGDHHHELNEAIRRADGVVALGQTNDLAPLYSRMDVLAFPSLREGFPNVPLEAAAAGVPAVGYRSTGVVDAIAHGVSGSIVAQHDVAGFADELCRYLSEPDLRRERGLRARERAIRSFSREVVWNEWERFYRARLESRVGHARGWRGA